MVFVFYFLITNDIQCHTLLNATLPTFDGFKEKTSVLIAGLRMVVLTTVLCKPSEELKDIVFLASGVEGETTLPSVILDWSDI